MHIITHCTKSFEAVIRTVASSWTSHYANSIFVYTDSRLNLDDRITQFKIGQPSDEREVNQFRKILSIEHHLKTHEREFTFLDADCLIMSKFDEVFEHDFTIGVTRFADQHSYPCLNSGVLFFKPKTSTDQLIQEWKGLAKQPCENTKMAVQESLHATCSSGKYDVKNFPKEIYNAFVPYPTPFSREVDELQWIQLAQQEPKPKIVHFLGLSRNRFKNISSLLEHYPRCGVKTPTFL